MQALKHNALPNQPCKISLTPFMAHPNHQLSEKRIKNYFYPIFSVLGWKRIF
jgi:hypothetical protein